MEFASDNVPNLSLHWSVSNEVAHGAGYADSSVCSQGVRIPDGDKQE